MSLYLALLVTAVLVAVFVGLPDVGRLRDDIGATGPMAPVLFVLVFAALTLAPLPKNVLATAAGLLFGLVMGIAIVLVGAMLGAMTAFILGRMLGRDAVERVTGVTVARIDTFLRHNGLLTIIVARLAPVVPFTAINYAAGLTAVSTRDYVVGTMIGIIPGTIAYVALGTYGTSPGSWPFIAAVIALVALTLLGVALTRRAHRRRPIQVSGSDTSA